MAPRPAGPCPLAPCHVGSGEAGCDLWEKEQIPLPPRPLPSTRTRLPGRSPIALPLLHPQHMEPEPQSQENPPHATLGQRGHCWHCPEHLWASHCLSQAEAAWPCWPRGGCTQGWEAREGTAHPTDHTPEVLGGGPGESSSGILSVPGLTMATMSVPVRGSPSGGCTLGEPTGGQGRAGMGSPEPQVPHQPPVPTDNLGHQWALAKSCPRPPRHPGSRRPDLPLGNRPLACCPPSSTRPSNSAQSALGTKWVFTNLPKTKQNRCLPGPPSGK